MNNDKGKKTRGQDDLQQTESRCAGSANGKIQVTNGSRQAQGAKGG